MLRKKKNDGQRFGERPLYADERLGKVPGQFQEPKFNISEK